MKRFISSLILSDCLALLESDQLTDQHWDFYQKQHCPMFIKEALHHMVDRYELEVYPLILEKINTSSSEKPCYSGTACPGRTLGDKLNNISFRFTFCDRHWEIVKCVQFLRMLIKCVYVANDCTEPTSDYVGSLLARKHVGIHWFIDRLKLPESVNFISFMQRLLQIAYGVDHFIGFPNEYRSCDWALVKAEGHLVFRGPSYSAVYGNYSGFRSYGDRIQPCSIKDGKLNSISAEVFSDVVPPINDVLKFAGVYYPQLASSLLLTHNELEYSTPLTFTEDGEYLQIYYGQQDRPRVYAHDLLDSMFSTI